VKNIVILFSGEGTNMINLIETLHDKVCNVAAAITNKPDAPGIAKARELGIHVDVIDHTHFDSRESFDEALVCAIRRYSPDLVVMAGFMRILSNVFTENVRAINLHPSLLPLFKGSRAIERSYESAEPKGGVSVHWVTDELDGGAIVMQEAFAKAEDETFESFHAKVKQIEHDILPKAVCKILGTEQP
jgi:phosphoribosylglycinamide formyltransferase-1